MHEENPDKKSENPQPDSVDRIVEIGLNTAKNYGLSFPLFAGRAGKEQILTTDDIAVMSIGLENVSLPHQLLTSLNPHEILAVLYGTGKMKSRNDYFEAWHNLRQSCNPDDMYKIINTIVNKIAWHETRGIPHYLGMLKKRRQNPHEDGPGMLEARVNLLRPETKNIFVNRFKQYPLLPGMHYEERAIFARNPINAYAGGIFKRFKQIYERNNPHQADSSDSPQSKNT